MVTASAFALELAAWMPDAATIAADLTFKPEPKASVTCSWKGFMFTHCRDRLALDFEGNAWSRSLAQNWQVPFVAAVVYLIAIPVLKRYIVRRGRVDVKRFAIWWNIFLSLFSLAGFLVCAPVLVAEVRSKGLYFATCAPAEWYGNGASGLCILLFIFSKLAELVDTGLLLFAGKPVILLHWWHNVSVLFYCWHSYSTQISTGIWFATMNYFLHWVLYAYFAATQTCVRRQVFSLTPYVTVLQVLEMLGGLWITVKAVSYQLEGRDCNANKTNSMLGLLLYSSNLLLFGKLFADHYLRGVNRPVCDGRVCDDELPAKRRSKWERMLAHDSSTESLEQPIVARSASSVRRQRSSRLVDAILAEHGLDTDSGKEAPGAGRPEVDGEKSE